jgi:dienelactone hydrolase
MGYRGLIFGLWVAATLAGQDVPPGKILDKVECRSNAKQSYALYLPASYSKARHWPILYCLDPMARGRAPVERFQAAAEKLGVIVVGSNNARNGPIPPIAEALQAMVQDAGDRLSLDPERIYAAGFSAAGQVTARWAENGRIAGIVLCGSSIDPSALPAKPSFRVFGAAGVDDFAYYDMHAMSVALAKRDVPNRFREFAGGHEWLPADAAEEALQFLAGQLPAAPATESKDLPELKSRLDGLVAQLSQAAGDPAHRQATGFRTQPDGTAYPASVSARLGDSMANVSGLPKDDLVRQNPQQLAAQLLDDSAKPADTLRRRLARQAITSAYMINSEWAERLIQAKDYAGAASCLEVVVLVRPTDGRFWYSLAVARAASGNKGKALAALKIAASNGFHDVAAMKREPLLSSIRGDRKYASLVQTMNATSPPAR